MRQGPLLALPSRPKVGNIDGDGDYPNKQGFTSPPSSTADRHGPRSWFEFVQDNHDKAFRIYSPASDSVLYSRTSPAPAFDNFTGDK